MIILVNESVTDPLLKINAMQKEVDLSSKNVNSVAIEQEHTYVTNRGIVIGGIAKQLFFSKGAC